MDTKEKGMNEQKLEWNVYQLEELTKLIEAGASYAELGRSLFVSGKVVRRHVSRYLSEREEAERMRLKLKADRLRWMGSVVRTCQSESLSSQEIRRRYGLSPKTYRLWSIIVCVPTRPSENEEAMLDKKRRKPKLEKIEDEKDRRIAELEWECYLREVEIELIKKKIEIKKRMAAERSKSGRQR